MIGPGFTRFNTVHMCLCVRLISVELWKEMSKKMHSLKKEKGGIVKCTRLRFHCGNELQPLGRKFLLLSKGQRLLKAGPSAVFVITRQ